MKPYHVITNVAVNNDKLSLIIDGKVYVYFFLKMSSRLSNASGVERERFEISPSGYGIHWPLLDEDISIDGLLGVAHCLPSKMAA
jgi:Protein of unknown function (DUF2442)